MRIVPPPATVAPEIRVCRGAVRRETPALESACRDGRIFRPTTQPTKCDDTVEVRSSSLLVPTIFFLALTVITNFSPPQPPPMIQFTVPVLLNQPQRLLLLNFHLAFQVIGS